MNAFRFPNVLFFAVLLGTLLFAGLVHAQTPIVSCIVSHVTFLQGPRTLADFTPAAATGVLATGVLYEKSLDGPYLLSSAGQVRISVIAPTGATARVTLNGEVQPTAVATSSPLTMSLTGLRTGCGKSDDVELYLGQRIPALGRIDNCDYFYLFKISHPCIGGDPQFSGLRGQSYQVHGIDGATYALISAPTYAVNSRFDFLDGPRPCATMPSSGMRSVACWVHPGSYLGSFGVVTEAGAQLVVESGPAATGFASATLNGKALPMNGEAVSFPISTNELGYVARNNTHEMVIQVGVFWFELENNDEFVNLRSISVSSNDWKILAADRVHGLLGQTWQSRRFSGMVKEIEGEVDDYVLEENDVLGHRFVFSRFNDVAAVVPHSSS